MIFIDELKWAFDVMVHPNKANQKWTVGGAAAMYYKVLIIPLIILVIIEALAGSIIASGLSSLGSMLGSSGAALGALSGGAVAAILIGSTLLDFLILVPIGFLIAAVVYLIFGMIFKAASGGYAGAFSAVVYSALPIVALLFLYWVPVLNFILAIWGIVLFVFAWANINKVSKGKAFLVWIVPVIIVLIIVLIVGVSLLSAFSHLGAV